MVTDPPSLDALAQQAQTGDKHAYQRLLALLTERLENLVHRRIFKPDHREDVMQEILMAVHRSLYSYCSDQSFLSWFYAIASHKITDYIRQHSKNTHVLQWDDQQEDLMFSDSRDIDTSVTLDSALEILSPTEKMVIRWLKLDGYRVKDVARFLDKKEFHAKDIIYLCLMNFLLISTMILLKGRSVYFYVFVTISYSSFFIIISNYETKRYDSLLSWSKASNEYPEGIA